MVQSALSAPRARPYTPDAHLESISQAAGLRLTVFSPGEKCSELKSRCLQTSLAKTDCL